MNREEMILSQEGWVKFLAMRFCKRTGWRDIDTAISVGYEGVIRAVDKYDPDKGTLTTYSKAWIIRNMLVALHCQRLITVPRRKADKAVEIVPIGDINEPYDQHDASYWPELRDDIEKARELSDSMFWDRYYHGMSIREVGEKHNVGRNTASIRINHTMSNLRRAFGVDIASRN